MTSATLDAPPGDIDRPDPDVAPLRDGMHALQAASARIADDRATALLLAAHLARLARAYRRDRDRLWLANLGLQADLDRSGVREAFTAAQIDGFAAHIVDLQAERRALAARNEALAAENARLRASSAADRAEARPVRGRWRR
jgi:hypothetical protein